MQYDARNLTAAQLTDIYKRLLLPRLVEEKMLLLLRQGKISKWFSGIGQEAISVGAAYALQAEEWIMPLHRNLGIFTGRNMPLHKLFLQWQGHKNGYSKGRERSFHFGSTEHHICGMISHLGPQLALACGTALAHTLRGEHKVCLAFSGEGGTSQGDFHEALNLAAVWNLPVIFLIENNGYGLSTPVHEQYRCHQLSHRAKGYGMEGITIDGNNILAVMDTIAGVRDYCIKHQQPYLIECMTFRMRGHEEASGIKYVPPHLFEIWKEKDPIENYERWLLTTGILLAADREKIKTELQDHIDKEWLLAQQAPKSEFDEAEELEDIYYRKPVTDTTNPSTEISIPSLVQNGALARFIDGIRDALYQSLQIHHNLVLMGQDIAEYGGAFKVTEGFAEKFGKQRIRNTPLCESAVIGAALGLALEGYRTVVEMQFADFVTMGLNQIVNNLAKIHYRWGQSAPVVVRMPTGAGVGAGPFHSQSNEAWFTHVPGLKVVYPSTPEDAKGLLIAAINDGNPVLFFEHKALYRSLEGTLPAHYYETPIGIARQVQQGSDISILTYGAAVHWALEYAKENSHISFDIVDLRTLQPLDYNAIKTSVSKTGKVLILHEDTLTGGVGAELSAWIAEHCFELLDAPVVRCASLNTPVPFNPILEQQFLAKHKLNECIEKLMHY